MEILIIRLTHVYVLQSAHRLWSLAHSRPGCCRSSALKILEALRTRARNATSHLNWRLRSFVEEALTPRICLNASVSLLALVLRQSILEGHSQVKLYLQPLLSTPFPSLAGAFSLSTVPLSSACLLYRGQCLPLLSPTSSSAFAPPRQT